MSSEEPKAQTPAAPAEESLPKAQVDGSAEAANGSPLAETEYKVEVKLADLQADPNNPLFSAKSFEELNLYAQFVPLRSRYLQSQL